MSSEDITSNLPATLRRTDFNGNLMSPSPPEKPNPPENNRNPRRRSQLLNALNIFVVSWTLAAVYQTGKDVQKHHYVNASMNNPVTWLATPMANAIDEVLGTDEQSTPQQGPQPPNGHEILPSIPPAEPA
jgi:hypothetical protein